MTAKIFRNSFFVGLLVLLAAGILFLSVMYANDETLAFDELETEMAVLAPAVERLGLPYLQELDAAGRVTWIAADGSVLYDNSARKDNMENHLAREEIAAALETGEGRATRDSQTGGARTHYIARRLADGSVLRTASVVEMLMPGCVGLPHGAWADFSKDDGIDVAGMDNVLCGSVTSGMGTSGYNNYNCNFEKYEGEALVADCELPCRTVAMA